MVEIKLKKWVLEDKENLIEICNKIDRQFLSNRIPYPYTEDSALWWLSIVNEHENKDGVFRAIVVDRKIVGTISVEQKKDVYEKDGEIGYYLMPEFSSRGIMSFAVQEICEIAFKELDLFRITGLVYEPNVASKKVLEKNGFQLEGIMKQAVLKNGNVYDLCIYGKLR